MAKFSKTELKELNEYVGQLETIRDAVERLKDERQELFDGKSERWQEGERGQEAQEQIDALDTLYNSIDGAVTELTDLLGDDFEG